MALYPEHKPFDGNPGGGGLAKPKPKPEESTGTNSPYRDFGNPSPPPSPPSSQPPPPAAAGTTDTPASQSSGQASSSDSGKQSKPSKKDVKDDPPADTDPAIYLPDLLTDAYDEAPTAEADWPLDRPLNPGQQMDVDYLLSFVTDTLARDVLITMRRDGIPHISQRNDFMAQHAEWGWDATSDATALEMIDKVEQSEMDEILAHADPPEEEHYIRLRVNGGLKVYENVEGMLRGDAASAVLPVIPDSFSILVLDQNPSHPYAVKISAAGNEFWIDLRDDAGKLEFERIDEVPQLYKRLRAQVSGQEYDNTSAYFLHSLREVQGNPQAIGLMTVSGTLRLYADEEFDQNMDTPFASWNDVDPLYPYIVVGFSELNPNAIEIDFGGGLTYWIDTSDPDAEFTVSGLREHGDTSTQAAEEVIANGNQPDYEILPIIPDEVAHGGYSNIEVSDSEWADRTGRDDDPTTKRGVLSRDYNHEPDEVDPERIHKPFRLQSPVVGPDVRVEFVVRDHETLGNYVVVSFPASYYQSQEAIMNQLAMQDQAASHLQNQSFAPHLTAEERAKLQRKARLADHNPDRWHEDGRIFYAFAHLSQVSVNAGEIIDGRDKAIIGMTGKSGTGAHHLDLAILYVGSSIPGSGAMAKAMFELGWDSGNADLFFGFSERSQLYPTNDISVLYGENLDSARLHPELDESGFAEFIKGYSIYAEE